MRRRLTRLLRSAPVRALGEVDQFGLLVAVMGLFELSVTAATAVPGWLGMVLGLLCMLVAIAAVVLRACARAIGREDAATGRRRAG